VTPVAEALDTVLDLFEPLDPETVPLTQAAGRVLAADAVARLNQPPFASSVMDGYAVRSADIIPGAQLTVIGESIAGARASVPVSSGQAVRIFTGAPVPEGADRVVAQEDCNRDGTVITLGDDLDSTPYVRPAGSDFRAGDRLSAPRRLNPAEISLLAAMNVAQVSVRRRPVVALITTGDELVMPGEYPAPDQIISSNNLGLAALIRAHGGTPRMLPIAPDTEPALTQAFAFGAQSDAIITLGGASVGDRDLVRQAAGKAGLRQSLYKVAMRPGKPLMAGTLHGTPVIGLPGNPVSAMVCGHVFVLPALRTMLGLPAEPNAFRTAELAINIGANGPRMHYMRARIDGGRVTPFARQDSSLLSVLADANCLMVRAPNAEPQKAGARVNILPL